MIGFLVGGRTAEYHEPIESRVLGLGPSLNRRQWRGRKTPDEISARRNIRPGRRLFQIEFHASVRRYMGEVLVRLTACREEGARCRGQRAGKVSAGIAAAENDDRMRHDGGNCWMCLCCCINVTTYMKFFYARLL